MSDVIKHYRAIIRQHIANHAALQPPPEVAAEARELFGEFTIVVPVERFVTLEGTAPRAGAWAVIGPARNAVPHQRKKPTMVRGSGKTAEEALKNARERREARS